jgi:hypothetical protein
MKKFNHFRNDSLEEVLKASDPTGKWIDDFVHSKNPKFAGKSKEQRIRMALGASYGAKKTNEESEICSICEHDPCICDEGHGFVAEDQDVKTNDKGEYDYEGQMARTQLQTTLRNCQDLIGMIEDGDNMPEWVQSKITLAQDYITSVRDYLQSKEELGEDKMVELGDLAVKKALKHRVLVTYSDPNHTMVSKRSEKQQKHIRVPIHNKQNETIYKGDAVDLAKQYVKKQGYKVHDAEHVGLVNVNEEVLDELSKDTLNAYMRAGHTAYPSASPDKKRKLRVGIKTAYDKANPVVKQTPEKKIDMSSPAAYYKSARPGQNLGDSVEIDGTPLQESSQTKEQIDDVHKTARYLSAKEGVVQHVNKDPETGEHHVSDWYHHENTVATYNNGRKKRD